MYFLLRLEDFDRLSGKSFFCDLHLKDLLVFSAKMEFHDHFLYKAGHIILQDKVRHTTPAFLRYVKPRRLIKNIFVGQLSSCFSPEPSSRQSCDRRLRCSGEQD